MTWWEEAAAAEARQGDQSIWERQRRRDTREANGRVLQFAGVQQQTCYWLECDSCGQAWADDQDGFVHHDSLARALDEIGPCKAPDYDACPDFHNTHGMLCRSCSHAADCAETGHLWDEWADVGPMNLLDGDVYVGRQRNCDRCSDIEFEPAIPKRQAPVTTR